MEEVKHFVDEHQLELIKRVNNVAPILDELLDRKVISQDSYDKIGALRTSQEKMRALCSTYLKAGTACKDVFYKILEENEPYLIADLKGEKDESLLDKVQVATMTAKKKLSETLNDLSSEELEEFKSLIELEKSFPLFSRRQQKVSNTQEVVELMVETYSQECVELTKKVLKKMNRTDLVQRFSDDSSGTKKKQSVDEHLSALIHKVTKVRAVKELLLGTFSDLSNKELKNVKWFLQFTFFQRNLPQISWEQQQWTDTTEALVVVMMKTCGRQSVEVTREIFMDMNRTDLVQRLSETSSGPKEKHSVDEHWPALIQEVEMMTSVIELLLETLKDLSDGELEELKEILMSKTFYHIRHSDTWVLQETRDMQDTVFLMVQTFGQQSVEKIKEVLKKMKRTDLVQRLSDSSSGTKNEQSSALIQKVATIAAVKQLLLETLNDLRNEELEDFKWFLQMIFSQKELQDISRMMKYTEDREQIVDQMVRTFGQQSVELTREIYMTMNRTDLVQRLSKSRSELKDKHSADEHRRARFERNAAERAVQRILLETLENLSHKELERFKRFLQFTCFQRSLPQIERSALEWAGSFRVVDLMMQTCGQQSLQVAEEIFTDMNRTDLLQRLSGASSGLKEKRSVDEQQSSLIQRVETMTSVIELLLETLKDLSDRELQTFNEGLPRSLHFHTHDSVSQSMALNTADMQDTVFLMVQHYGQKSVEMTKEVLKRLKKTDLVKQLSDSNSGPKKKQSVDEHLSALIHKVATMAAVKELLLETFSDLSYEELKNFRWFLQFTFFQRNLPQTSWEQQQRANRAYVLVTMMMKTCGRQSVEVTRKIFMDMNRTDLVQRLSETSSGPKEIQTLGSRLGPSSHINPTIFSHNIQLAPQLSNLTRASEEAILNSLTPSTLSA